MFLHIAHGGVVDVFTLHAVIMFVPVKGWEASKSNWRPIDNGQGLMAPGRKVPLLMGKVYKRV